MALEVLAGPSAIAIAGTGASGASGGFHGTWIQGLGLLTSVTAAGGSPGLYAVELDGTAHLRNVFSPSEFVLDLRRNRGLFSRPLAALFDFDWLASSASDTAEFTPSSSSVAAVCADRFLEFTGDQVLSSLLSDGATFTAEYTFSAPDPGGAPLSISPGRTETEVCVGFCSTGQLRFYDVVAKRQVGATLYAPESFDGAWYIAKHDIFVELLGTDIKILANAVRPATLAAPTALSAVTAGRVSQVRTQLTGSHGEPCAGELINWSVSAGAGSLDVAQSETDEDGYAYANYISPIGASGSVSIDAEVAF